MPGKTDLSELNCSLARTLDVVGDWWTLLIIRDAFLGITRFDDFRERLGIARNILTNRLDTLVDAGVLERRLYDEARDRYDYVLTAKGRALWPVLTTLRQWGDKYIVGRGQEPIKLRHETCGHVATAHLACDTCGERMSARDVTVLAGPGLEDETFLPSR